MSFAFMRQDSAIPFNVVNINMNSAIYNCAITYQATPFLSSGYRCFHQVSMTPLMSKISIFIDRNKTEIHKLIEQNTMQKWDSKGLCLEWNT